MWAFDVIGISIILLAGVLLTAGLFFFPAALVTVGIMLIKAAGQ